MKQFSRKDFLRNFAFNLRWGQLLECERSKAGVSQETLAANFKLDPTDIARWETGFGSPMAKIFYQIIVYLGPEAYRNAAKLWCDVQIEQYFIQMKLLNASKETRERRPAYLALGAIKDRYAAAAA